jgi:hypothetical protein
VLWIGLELLGKMTMRIKESGFACSMLLNFLEKFSEIPAKELENSMNEEIL